MDYRLTSTGAVNQKYPRNQIRMLRRLVPMRQALSKLRSARFVGPIVLDLKIHIRPGEFVIKLFRKSVRSQSRTRPSSLKNSSSPKSSQRFLIE